MSNTSGWLGSTFFNFRATRSSALALGVALSGFGVGALAWGHDYWLLVDRWRLAPGADVVLSLWVGDDFVPEEERAWARGRALRFARVSSRGVEDLLGRPLEDARPLLTVRVPTAGGQLFVLDRNVARIELPADRFERYLRDEGLDAIVEARRARGESGRPGRERYTRYLKAFAQAGGAYDAVATRVVGQTFELVARHDLARARVGGSAGFVARFRGAPLAGVTVEALSRVGDDVRRARAVTNARGEVDFTLDREGTWLVRATQMVRCEGCADADWESFWSSYSFGVCAPRSVTCAAAPMTLRPPNPAAR